MLADPIDTIIAKLTGDGIPVPDEALEQLARHAALVREMSQAYALVSKRDLPDIERRHIVDSLALAPVVCRLAGASATLLDIGGGGGFPAIPLKIVLPKLTMTLVERSEKRSWFLRKVVGDLRLTDVDVRFGEFPSAVKDIEPSIITARAVEKPEQLLKQVRRFLPVDSVFLCQSGDPGDPNDMFHVEHIKDEWSSTGLRRGSLHAIRRTS